LPTGSIHSRYRPDARLATQAINSQDGLDFQDAQVGSKISSSRLFRRNWSILKILSIRWNSAAIFREGIDPAIAHVKGTAKKNAAVPKEQRHRTSLQTSLHKKS
jgi:hypothetical protein